MFLRAIHPSRRRVILVLEILEDRTVPTLLGQQLFPSNNPWNQRITDAPVAGNSAAIMNSIINTYGNGRLHPDFSQDFQDNRDLYGIPFNVVRGNTQPKVQVIIDAYPDESDLSDVPIPSGAVIEGDYQNGPRDGVDNRGDSHLIIWDQDNNIGYELFRASRPSENADGKWHADQLSVWDMKTNSFRTLGWTSADAAGLAILPGLVRPDEALPVAQGGQGVINHAIRFTLRNAVILNQYLYPASHKANPGNNNAAIQPPMGARLRLKASVDISNLNPQARIVAQAMKDYGMIVADNGSNFFFSGASYAVDANNNISVTWNDNDIQSTTSGLKSLRYGDFEVVDLTPIVTGLSITSGQSGSPMTIAGKNFTGAAGQIKVLFGNAQATSVTVVNDTTITATVPAGAGTVDVRVQSGANAPGNSANIKNPVFGYGTSATTPNARFTYGTGNPPPPPPPTNQPPTVARAAQASPNPVSGQTTSLSVLGADDGGETNLSYAWALLSGPAGVSLSLNNSNAARTATATFDRAGTYHFRVTVRDAQGLTTTSDVIVNVVQTLTSIRISPTSATIKPRGRVQFAALGLDQFGQELGNAPAFSWSVVSGGGTISSGGLYHAPNKQRGQATIRVSANGLTATASVTLNARLRARRTLRASR